MLILNSGGKADETAENAALIKAFKYLDSDLVHGEDGLTSNSAGIAAPDVAERSHGWHNATHGEPASTRGAVGDRKEGIKTGLGIIELEEATLINVDRIARSVGACGDSAVAPSVERAEGDSRGA